MPYDICLFDLDGTLTDPKRGKSAVMIGDRKHDILAADEIGIDSIVDTWGYGSRNELQASEATWIVDSIDELYRLIIGEKNERHCC